MKKVLMIVLGCLLALSFGACSVSGGTQNAPGNADGVTQDNYGAWIEDLN